MDIQDAYQKAWWKERIHAIVQKFRADPNSIDEQDWDVVEHGEDYLHKFWLDSGCRMPWIKKDLVLLCEAVWATWNNHSCPGRPIS
ncbi:MAG: hypothetical protein HYX67_05180 [Candidatus Melainabacteria bacterium]|nr:hypothetical protein [Candidatus Melainabacteria bacterium]